MDKTTNWTKRWNCWVAPTKLPGVWKRKEGGHLVRARVTEPTTGCKKEIRKVLPEANEAIAYQWLADERARVKAGALSTTLAVSFRIVVGSACNWSTRRAWPPRSMSLPG